MNRRSVLQKTAAALLGGAGVVGATNPSAPPIIPTPVSLKPWVMLPGGRTVFVKPGDTFFLNDVTAMGGGIIYDHKWVPMESRGEGEMVLYALMEVTA